MTDNTPNIIGLLREVEIFSGFDDEILKQFSENMNEVFLKKGEILFNKGEKENSMFIVLDGAVEIHDNDYIFTTLNSKQFFGEYTLIDSSVRSASVTAVQETKLLELKQEVFNRVTQESPEIWKSVLITLIKRLRDYNIVEEKLTMRTVEIRKKKYEVEQEKDNISNEKKELEAINSTKNKFFTIIGNDLKKPFSTVIKMTDTLLSKFNQFNEKQTIDYIEQINRYSKNAYNLLENLLQWSRSQTGSLKINFTRANLKAIVDNIIELYSVDAKQKTITLTSNVDSELHGYIDIETITTVIRNLVSNSLKYTNKNGIINIKTVEIDDMIQVEISDTGIGISKENQKNIFNINKETNNDNTEISGLGMVLIKEFILKNGGKIWVESELNKGTTFKFTLPKAL